MLITFNKLLNEVVSRHIIHLHGITTRKGQKTRMKSGLRSQFPWHLGIYKLINAPPHPLHRRFKTHYRRAVNNNKNNGNRQTTLEQAVTRRKNPRILHQVQRLITLGLGIPKEEWSFWWKRTESKEQGRRSAQTFHTQQFIWRK